MPVQILTPKEIITLREELGRSQESFAKILGVTGVTVCRWETARFKPNNDMQVRLMKLWNFNEKRKAEAG